ncbi:SitI3 family protein [Micromonospora sp. WMMA1923]|uniref:SitI3 family protein n=1 Tax=Micromonospora sp. WMMA1923 TaxID=3404125 RepID=UPI003B94B580
MSISYRLTLAGDIPLQQVADLAAPHATETTAPAGNRLLSADLYAELGYLISITSGHHGYYDAEDDNDTYWEWEPEQYTDISFDMRTDDLADKGIRNMAAAVARILTRRTEDAALVQDGNHLLLTRTAGTIRKHRPSWWHHYHLHHHIT